MSSVLPPVVRLAADPLVDVRIMRMAADDLATSARWDAFVDTCPGATFFHRAGWQRILRGIFRHDAYFLYVETGGEIQAVLPLAHVRSRLFGSSLTGLPFAVYGGVVGIDAAAMSALEAEAQRIAVSVKADHLELRNLERRHDDWPEQDLYVTFRREIFAEEEANLNAIPRKQRAMVRKGIKNGLQSAVDPGIERFFPVYADNVHRHGTPALPKKYFEALLREFPEHTEVMTVTAPDVDGKPGAVLSSVLSFYFRDEVLPYYAGDAVAARDLAANDFKYWELMRRSCARGIRIFDYGRSKRGTGSFAFKKNWGFEPQPLHYEFCLYKHDSIPQNNPNNAKYKLLIQTWRRMPIGLANFLGPFLVRSLG